VGAITFVAGGGATGFGGAGVAVTAVGGATDFGATSGGATPVTASVPDGIGAPSGTRAVGVPIVSGGLFSGFGGGIFFSVGAASSCGLISGVEIVSAVIVDPTADLARAAGVLNSPEVEAIGTEPAVTALSALGAGAPAAALTRP